MLPDNSVIPSYLGVSIRGEENSTDRLDNTRLRLGEVKKIVYPSDKTSLSKKFVEYILEVNHKDGNSAPVPTLYAGVVLSNLFGGWADKLRYTLRQDSQDQQSEQKENIYGVGSKVLFLCISGDTDNAIILGGVPDVGTKEDQKEEDQGHNLFFEFNGCQFTINKDGEMQLKFRGATKVDGKLDDNAVKEAEGSSLTINKEGNIKWFTKDDDQFVEINHKDKKINMQAQKEWNTTVKGTVNLTADNKVNIKSEGVYVGDATDAWMLGSTYRQNEGQMNSKVSGQFNALQGLLQTAGINLTAAAPLNAIPMAGGGLASGNFTAAATAITSAASLCSQIASAIKTFESSADSYLSKKNKND